MPGAPAHVAPGGYPPTGPSGPPPMGTPFGQPHHAQQPYAYGQNALVSSRPVPGKSPATAAVLSTFFPGAGQLYNGQVGKGLVVFFGFMFLAAAGPLALVPWLWGISDAHKTSKQQSAAQHYGLLGP